MADINFSPSVFKDGKKCFEDALNLIENFSKYKVGDCMDEFVAAFKFDTEEKIKKVANLKDDMETVISGLETARDSIIGKDSQWALDYAQLVSSDATNMSSRDYYEQRAEALTVLSLLDGIDYERKQELEKKKKDGTITSSERLELDEINDTITKIKNCGAAYENYYKSEAKKREAEYLKEVGEIRYLGNGRTNVSVVEVESATYLNKYGELMHDNYQIDIDNLLERGYYYGDIEVDSLVAEQKKYRDIVTLTGCQIMYDEAIRDYEYQVAKDEAEHARLVEEFQNSSDGYKVWELSKAFVAGIPEGFVQLGEDIVDGIIFGVGWLGGLAGCEEFEEACMSAVQYEFAKTWIYDPLADLFNINEFARNSGARVGGNIVGQIVGEVLIAWGTGGLGNAASKAGKAAQVGAKALPYFIHFNKSSGRTAKKGLDSGLDYDEVAKAAFSSGAVDSIFRAGAKVGFVKNNVYVVSAWQGSSEYAKEGVNYILTGDYDFGKATAYAFISGVAEAASFKTNQYYSSQRKTKMEDVNALAETKKDVARTNWKAANAEVDEMYSDFDNVHNDSKVSGYLSDTEQNFSTSGEAKSYYKGQNFHEYKTTVKQIDAEVANQKEIFDSYKYKMSGDAAKTVVKNTIKEGTKKFDKITTGN